MNNKTKVEYMGKRLKVVSVGIKNKVIRFVKTLFKVALFLSVIYAIYFFGKLNGTSTVYQSNVVEKEVIVEVSKKSAVMERIAKCESSSGHYGPSGQVIFNGNNNGSVDVGKYQINSVWFKKATELGFDLTVEKDNEAFAMWIYDNKGTEPWYSSRGCWLR